MLIDVFFKTFKVVRFKGDCKEVTYFRGPKSMVRKDVINFVNQYSGKKEWFEWGCVIVED